jgi:acetyltransferase-like isoleucine patch superfamily enzyme/dTDP-4-dehydrorhamnose 3,5-epimerase-like enzyme
VSIFVHPQGVCESHQIGDGTRIWAFTHVLSGARIGRDCNICDHVFIENDVSVGDRVTIKSGVQLWDGLRVEDDVFIGPNATFTNDRFPRSKQHRKPLETRICQGASLSANCTVLPGLVIGRHAMIGAGAVVTHDVPARAIVSGNPARITGYVDATKLPTGDAVEAGAHRLLSGALLRQFAVHVDLRGSLTVCDFTEHLPFVPKRFFTVYSVPGKDVRGEHAHRQCHQFLMCVNGSLWILLDDGQNREELQLDSPSLGLYIPPMVWSVQYRYSQDGVLLVVASEPYDPDDYIRDYEEFLRLRSAQVS